jgi:hypothetical protein
MILGVREPHGPAGDWRSWGSGGGIVQNRTGN